MSIRADIYVIWYNLYPKHKSILYVYSVLITESNKSRMIEISAGMGWLPMTQKYVQVTWSHFIDKVDLVSNDLCQ